jgi:S1-C subfamily serine protease
MDKLKLHTLLVFFFSFTLLNCAEAADERRISISVDGDDESGIGLVIQSMNPAQQEKFGAEKGALILAVLPGSSAALAGLEKDDVIIRANGNAIADAEGLNEIAEELAKGAEISLQVLRDGEELSFSAQVSDFPDDEQHFTFISDDGEADIELMVASEIESDVAEAMREVEVLVKAGPQKGGYLGAQVEDLNKQLAVYFEVDQGALIERVEEGTPADDAGLLAGDVIVRINEREIADPADVIRTIRFYDPGETVRIFVSRKGVVQSFNVTLAERSGSKSLSWVAEDEEAFVIRAPRSARHNLDHEKIMQRVMKYRIFVI